jgi:hypothetical protein
MDLQLAAYKQGKTFAKFNEGPQPIPKRRPAFFMPLHDGSNTDLDKIVKRLRHSTWKRQESHNKQLQHFINRENYSQNQTWQNEHDRLASVETAPGLQPFVNQRLDALKSLMI